MIRSTFFLCIMLTHMHTMQGFAMHHNFPGFLCVIEGVDGSGKTTLITNLKDRFVQTTIPHIFTREPGATQLGKQLRNIIINQKIPTCPIAEFLLFAADRAQHFLQLVIPYLKQGFCIVSDRMADSSLAYQGYGRGLSIDHIKIINAWCMQNIEPDLIIYLKIDNTHAQQRLMVSRGNMDQFEINIAQGLQKRIDGFNEIFAYKDNVVTFDALVEPQQLADEVFACIISRLESKCHAA